jgi:hypothetical protein
MMGRMSQPPESPDSSGEEERDRSRAGGQESARAEAARRARLAAVFGDLLPETTADERDPSSAAGRGEDWYRENRPPHHDRT